MFRIRSINQPQHHWAHQPVAKAHDVCYITQIAWHFPSMCKWLVCAVLLILTIWSASAHAAATTCSSAGGNITLPPITLPSNPAVGTLLGTPVSVTVTFNCSNLPFEKPDRPDYYADTATIQAGLLAPADASDEPTANDGIMFATNLPGIALKLTASPVQANDRAWLRGGPGSTRGFEPAEITAPSSAWKCIDQGWFGCNKYGGTYSGSAGETFTAQLVVTGPVTPGTVNAITLMQFNWYVYGISPSQGYFASLTFGGTTVSPPVCDIEVDPTVVTLPTVVASEFGGLGSTLGEKPFEVKLNCPTSRLGTTIAITLETSNPAGAGTHGVIAPHSGSEYAQGVGVQIVNGSGHTIDFGNAIDAVTITSAAFGVPLKARYYKTGNPVTAGLVKATATYTLSYP